MRKEGTTKGFASHNVFSATVQSKREEMSSAEGILTLVLSLVKHSDHTNQFML